MAEVDKNKSPIGNAELAQRFVQFVMMQAQNIFYVLGRIPSQDGRPIPPNLEAAKVFIDQLEMIQAKTDGNLSKQEIGILEDCLRNVRLAFVEASGGTPASMMPPSAMPEFPLDEGEELDVDPDAASLPKAAAPAEKAKSPMAETKPAPAPEESKKKFTKTYG